jgi:hypothetical protein
MNTWQPWSLSCIGDCKSITPATGCYANGQGSMLPYSASHTRGSRFLTAPASQYHDQASNDGLDQPASCTAHPLMPPLTRRPGKSGWGPNGLCWCTAGQCWAVALGVRPLMGEASRLAHVGWQLLQSRNQLLSRQAAARHNK